MCNARSPITNFQFTSITISLFLFSLDTIMKWIIPSNILTSLFHHQHRIGTTLFSNIISHQDHVTVENRIE